MSYLVLNELFPFADKNYVNMQYKGLRDYKKNLVANANGTLARHAAMRKFRKDPQMREQRISALRAFKQDSDVRQKQHNLLMTGRSMDGKKVYIDNGKFNTSGRGIEVKPNPSLARTIAASTRFGKNYT